MSSLTRQALESWIGEITIEAESKVLDIGGSQNPIQKRLKCKGECTEYKILDLEQPHECKKKPDIVWDLNTPTFTIENEIKFENGKLKDTDMTPIRDYDVAFCIEVTEYWWNPIQALDNINSLLKKGGILYISFHFWYPVHNPSNEDYLRYTIQGAWKMLQEAGFIVQESKPRELSDNGIEIYNILVNSEKMRPSRDTQPYSGVLIKAIKE